MGRTWKFGDDVSTDLIAPGRYYHLRSDLPELAKHVLEDARTDFASGVRPGDFVVGGRNFGKGSSREHAVVIIKLVGTRAIFAKSFARIFYRNCINNGLLAVVCDTDAIEDGDKLEVDLTKGIVRDVTRKLDIAFAPPPPFMEEILREGGMVPYLEKHGALEAAP